MNLILETVWAYCPYLLGLIVVYFLVRISMEPLKFFSERGIPFKTPVPIFGSLAALILRRESYYDMLLNSYNQFKGNK